MENLLTEGNIVELDVEFTGVGALPRGTRLSVYRIEGDKASLRDRKGNLWNEIPLDYFHKVN